MMLKELFIYSGKRIVIFAIILSLLGNVGVCSLFLLFLFKVGIITKSLEVAKKGQTGHSSFYILFSQ